MNRGPLHQKAPSRSQWAEYERLKSALQFRKPPLTAKQYEREIDRILRGLGL